MLNSKFVKRAVQNGDEEETSKEEDAQVQISDGRTLYEQLRDNRQKKEDEERELSRMSNHVPQYVKEDVDFLKEQQLLAEKQQAAERRERENEIARFRQQAAGLEVQRKAGASVDVSKRPVAGRALRRSNLAGALAKKSTGYLLEKGERQKKKNDFQLKILSKSIAK